jgi:hypothetical protein
VVYGIANFGLILYGVLALLNPTILMDLFSEYVYRFPIQAAGAAAYLNALFRLMGYFNLLLGILGLILLWRWTKSQGSWILLTVILLTFCSYLGPVVFDNIVGHIGTFEILEHIIFITVIFFGLIAVESKDVGIWNRVFLPVEYSSLQLA